ncbi:MAG TPA: flagellar FlbD family protein [Solirubrobacteraceae bacterium]|nr:flagellar FlbD family protein [Solirubrobacteraceae bacterium]
MIVLHRLGHAAEPFHLNSDLIVTVEACPDTVVTLATGARILVCEDPQQIARAILRWKADIRRGSLRAIRTEDLARATDHAGP